MRYFLIVCLFFAAGCSGSRLHSINNNCSETDLFETWVPIDQPGQTISTYYDSIGNRRVIYRSDGNVMYQVFYMRNQKILLKLPGECKIKVTSRMLRVLTEGL